MLAHHDDHIFIVKRFSGSKGSSRTARRRARTTVWSL